jgi:multiple sugar transport system substrate-binding protein
VKVINESLDDVQPKASVAANTNQGPDMFWGLYSLPHLFPAKCVDVTDVAGYLGKKYGGWVSSAETYGKGPGGKWIAIPVAYNGNVINYRQSMIEKAGFKEVPKDTAGFLDLMKGLKEKSVPGGFALGRASGDGNAWVHWALWSQGANLVDAKDKVIINSPETVKALEYCKALSDTFVAGTASWNDAFNNKAFLESQVSLTNNGVSIYAAAKAAAAKGDAKAKEVMDDMNHSLWPIGPAGKPTEFHIAYPLMIMKYSKVPNACKAQPQLHRAGCSCCRRRRSCCCSSSIRWARASGWASPTRRSAAPASSSASRTTIPRRPRVPDSRSSTRSSTRSSPAC